MKTKRGTEKEEKTIKLVNILEEVFLWNGKLSYVVHKIIRFGIRIIIQIYETVYFGSVDDK